MTAVYHIAELNIAVNSLYNEVHCLCADYLAAGLPVDFLVETGQADIDRERELSAREAAYEGLPLRQHSDEYLETLAVYRKIAEMLPAYDTFLFHGSCISVDGRGYLFTAKSGMGKSTHTRLWRELLGKRAVMVNDDKPLIRITEEGPVIYGTPWNGKHRLGSNLQVPLKALCILEQAPKNSIEPICWDDAYPMLLQQTYRPADIDAMRRTLVLLDRLAGEVPLWRMKCNMDIEAAQLAYDTMNGGKP